MIAAYLTAWTAALGTGLVGLARAALRSPAWVWWIFIVAVYALGFLFVFSVASRP